MELYLLMQFTDPNFSFLAGDSAQTIARGIAFRFSDLKTLFKYMHDEGVGAGGGAAMVEVRSGVGDGGVGDGGGGDGGGGGGGTPLDRKVRPQWRARRQQAEIPTPTPHSLVTSYRSHAGVLRLASAVVEVGDAEKHSTNRNPRNPRLVLDCRA